MIRAELQKDTLKSIASKKELEAYETKKQHARTLSELNEVAKQKRQKEIEAEIERRRALEIERQKNLEIVTREKIN